MEASVAIAEPQRKVEPTPAPDAGKARPEISPSDSEFAEQREKESRMELSLSRVFVGGTTDNPKRFYPGTVDPVTPEEKKKLAEAKDLSDLTYAAAEQVSLESRGDAKNFTVWSDRTKKWVEYKVEQDDHLHDHRIAAFKAIGILADDGTVNVDKFYDTYLNGKSDIKQFVIDISQGIESTQDSLYNLMQRLQAVEGLLKSFGETHNVDLLVRDFAVAREGLMNWPKENVVNFTSRLTTPIPDEYGESAYLKALARHAQDLVDKKTAAPAQPSPTPDAPTTPTTASKDATPSATRPASPPERTTSQGDQYSLRVEGKDGQPGFTIRMGGESVASPAHPNEDNYWFDARHMAGFVADGMGGMGDRANGDPARASQAVRESMQQSFENMPPLPTLKEAREWLRKQVMLANAAVLREQQKADKPIAVGAGSTLTAVMVWRGPNGEMELITANVGDSRMSYIRNNKLRDLTFDQGVNLRRRKDGSWRPADEVRDLQRVYGDIEDPSQLTGEAKEYWDNRAQMIAAVDGKLDPRNIEVQNYPVAYGSKIRILGRSDGLTDVTTNRATIAVASDFADPQQAAHALVEKAVKDDSGLRNKGYGDDKSIFVMDIEIDQPSTAEIDGLPAGPVTFDDARLVKMIFNEDSDLYTQLTEFLPDSERGAWLPDQEKRAEDGMRELFNVEYEGFPTLIPGSSLQEARDALRDKALAGERQRAASEPTRRKLDYQIGSFGGGHFLHFGRNFDPSPGTADAFPSAHRIYAVPQKWAVGEVAAEVIRRARAAGYEPYGKVWDEAKVVDVKERSSRKDRILFLPRTQREQDILLKALKDIQDAKPELFEDNPLILTKKVDGLKGVGIAEEPVQDIDPDGVFEKKSFNSSREELLGAAREYILSKWISPKADGTIVAGPNGRFVDRRVLALEQQLTQGTHTRDELTTFLQKVIRGLSPKYNVDPDDISRNLLPKSGTASQ